MISRGDRHEFETELHESLETAQFKNPRAVWDATVKPLWEVGREVLKRHGYDCELSEDGPGTKRIRVWNETLEWHERDAAQLAYDWGGSQVKIVQKVGHQERSVTAGDGMPIGRLTTEKVKEHLRVFMKEIKDHLSTLPDPDRW